MRLSDEKYIQTASNHISGLHYNKIDRILKIQFYNGAIYEYLGVPLGNYEAMKQAPSHGIYLWDNIRGKFPYRKLKANSLKGDSLRGEILPELSKLDALDEKESRLNAAFKSFQITESEYVGLLSVINNQRDKLTTKLENAGYFDSDTDSTDCESDETNQNLFESLLSVISYVFKLGFKILLLIFGIFFGLMGTMVK